MPPFDIQYIWTTFRFYAFCEPKKKLDIEFDEGRQSKNFAKKLKAYVEKKKKKRCHTKIEPVGLENVR